MSRNSGLRVNNVHVRGDNNGNGGIEGDTFLRLWSRGNPATQPTPRAQIDANGGVDANSFMKVSCLSEDIDLGGAASVTSTNNLLPANSIILYLVCTPLIDFSTPVTYNIGDTTTTTRFATGLANDNVSEGPAYATAHWTGTVAMRQVAAGKVRIVPNAAGTGRLRVTVYFLSFAGAQA